MATEFKHAHFYGIDISPNYPTAIKPPNTFFIQYDILNPKGLPFPDSYFDYVFMRQVYTCFSSSDWTVSNLIIFHKANKKKTYLSLKRQLLGRLKE